MKHEKITINIDGQTREAIAPLIISASRSTDIPAFYSSWFMNRLREGYCIWKNPFNGKNEYISFQNCVFIVFWTKNPAPLIPFLPALEQMGINYYFQFTLNDYEAECFEPNLPCLQTRVKIFNRLSHLVGPERVIWRFDPLIKIRNRGIDYMLEKISNLGNQLKFATDKLVVSFVDIERYTRVRNKLSKSGFVGQQIDEFPMLMQNRMAGALGELRNMWLSQGWNIRIATCAEEGEFNSYGIEASSCVDGELIATLINKQGEDKKIFHEEDRMKKMEKWHEFALNLNKMRDNGQRKLCRCVLSKDIGSYNTCGHFCLYCYANGGVDNVKKNMRRHSEYGESII